jgi:hypothetical protein
VVNRVGLVVVSLCTVVLYAAETPSPSIVRVRVAFIPLSSGLIDSVRADAVEEAAHVWEPYGVAILNDTLAERDPDSPHISVVMDGVRVRSSRHGALGSIQFAPDGTPDSTIAIDYSAVVRLATTTSALGIDAHLWPVKLREQIIARALGRALAHEVGHYVLRSPHHTATGLMRATYRAGTLAMPERTDFTLTPPDLERLRVVMAAGLLGHGIP